MRALVFDKPRSAARPPRACAFTARAPYLALKIAWVSGSRIGIPMAACCSSTTPRMIVGNSASVLIDSMEVGCTAAHPAMGSNAPGGFPPILPAWAATGLLSPIMVGYPLQLGARLLGGTAAPLRRTPPPARSWTSGCSPSSTPASSSRLGPGCALRPVCTRALGTSVARPDPGAGGTGSDAWRAASHGCDGLRSSARAVDGPSAVGHRFDSADSPHPPLETRDPSRRISELMNVTYSMQLLAGMLVFTMGAYFFAERAAQLGHGAGARGQFGLSTSPRADARAGPRSSPSGAGPWGRARLLVPSPCGPAGRTPVPGVDHPRFSGATLRRLPPALLGGLPVTRRPAVSIWARHRGGPPRTRRRPRWRQIPTAARPRSTRGSGGLIVVSFDELLVVDAEVAKILAVVTDLLRQRDHAGHSGSFIASLPAGAVSQLGSVSYQPQMIRASARAARYPSPGLQGPQVARSGGRPGVP